MIDIKKGVSYFCDSFSQGKAEAIKYFFNIKEDLL